MNRSMMNSDMSTAMAGPFDAPKVNVSTAPEPLRLQGTTKPKDGSETAPTPPAIAFARLSGKYVFVVPLSRMTGTARLSLEYWLFPDLLAKETFAKATVKDEMPPL